MVEQRVTQTTAVRLIQSFGATRVIFSYCPDLEVLKMQAVCRFLYDIGISRSQTVIKLFAPIFFLHPSRLETVFVLNCRNNEVMKQPLVVPNEDDLLALYDWQWKSCLLVRKLYITGGAMQSHQCVVVEPGIPGTFKMRKLANMTKPRNEHSCSTFKGKYIIVTGSSAENFASANTCEMYDIHKNEWQLLPELVRPR